MFTGIIQNTCSVVNVDARPGFTRYAIENPFSELHKGASISIDGVCQTIVDFSDQKIWLEAIDETLKRTNLKFLKEGQQVNVERSARFGDEIGGHVLSGHIYGTAEIHSLQRSAYDCIVTFHCLSEWTKYLFPKGFIALNGASLTLVDINPKAGSFTVHLIPETLKKTTFGSKKTGDLVNLELDYQTQAIVDTVERVLASRASRD
jgi:riboflavin synthase